MRLAIHARFHLWVGLERFGILLHRRRVRGGGGRAIARGRPLGDEGPVWFDVRHRGGRGGDAEEGEEGEERDDAHVSVRDARRALTRVAGVVAARGGRARWSDAVRAVRIGE